MNISRGIIPGAKKVVIYGVEGIGKSTLAASFPAPVYIDTEGSTKALDVARFEPPTSWPMLLAQVQYVIDHPDICRTLVLDTADWAEQIMISHICSKNDWKGLEDPGYGKGYQYAAEEWGGQLLNRLTEVVNRGVNVVITAHAWLRKVDAPEESKSYDHWEMKTSKKVAPMLREWADMVLFLNYEVIVYENKEKKTKAQGGQRVMYTTHTPYWDAKNRYGLPEKLPLDYGRIAHLFQPGPAPVPVPPPQPVQPPAPAAQIPQAPNPGPTAQATAPVQNYEEIIEPDPDCPFSGPSLEAPAGIPKPLWDLMQHSGVTEEEIVAAVAQKGYFPSNMRIANYPADFVQGVLIGAWDQVHLMIINNRNN